MKTTFKFLFFTFLFTIGLQAQSLQIPIEISKNNKAIFLKLPVENQKDSLVFFLDTGAGTALLDSASARKFKIYPTDKLDVSGAGGKKSYDIATNQRIFLSKNHYIDSTSIVLEDITKLTTLYDTKFDGIIGATLFNNYITKIDIENSIMSLYDFNESIDTNGFYPIPFEFSFGIPKFPLAITLENQETFTGDILFDSGAGLTVLINAPFNRNNKLSEKIKEKITYSSTNLSNKTTYEEGLIKSIQLGNEIIEKKNLTISISSDKEGVSSFENLLGILGSEIINRFNFILDYKRQIIYLKPNSLFDSDFKISRSPLSFKYNADRSQIIIATVLKDTDAYKQGLREGQQIITINNKFANDIYGCHQLLKTSENATIRYMENNQIKTVKINL